MPDESASPRVGITTNIFLLSCGLLNCVVIGPSRFSNRLVDLGAGRHQLFRGGITIQRSPGEAELAASDHGPAHRHDPLDQGDISSDL